MSHTDRLISSFLLAAALISQVAIAGCAARASYRVYDPYYNDYHRWDDREAGFYVQWEGETHREHRDFDKREKDEQNEYWTWRHSHSDERPRQTLALLMSLILYPLASNLWKPATAILSIRNSEFAPLVEIS